MTSQPSRRGEPAAPDPLPMPVVDNHTHLDLRRDGEPVTLDDLRAVIDAATRVGVDRLVQIGCDLASARFAVDAANRYEQIVAGVALHPNEAPRLAEQGEFEAAFAQIEALATDPRVRTIGETGMDAFRTDDSGRAAQEESFRRHIDLAKRLRKPLQIHDRDTHDEVLRILDDEGAPERVVLHCFSGDIGFARACVERGYYLSFAGTVTFKNAAPLRNALAIVPIEKVLVETDAPYLTPHPWRGADNSPMLLPLTLRVMAGVMSVDVASLALAISATSEDLYGPW